MDTKSTGAPLSRQKAKKSGIQALLEVAGPPTRRALSTAFTARAVTWYSLKYSSLEAAQKP